MALELFVLASAGSLLYSAITGGGSGDSGGMPNPLGALIGTALGGVVGN